MVSWWHFDTASCRWGLNASLLGSMVEMPNLFKLVWNCCKSSVKPCKVFSGTPFCSAFESTIFNVSKMLITSFRTDCSVKTRTSSLSFTKRLRALSKSARARKYWSCKLLHCASNWAILSLRACVGSSWAVWAWFVSASVACVGLFLFVFACVLDGSIIQQIQI